MLHTKMRHSGHVHRGRTRLRIRQRGRMYTEGGLRRDSGSGRNVEQSAVDKRLRERNAKTFIDAAVVANLTCAMNAACFLCADSSCIGSVTDIAIAKVNVRFKLEELLFRHVVATTGRLKCDACVSAVLCRSFHHLASSDAKGALALPRLPVDIQTSKRKLAHNMRQEDPYTFIEQLG